MITRKINLKQFSVALFFEASKQIENVALHTVEDSVSVILIKLIDQWMIAKISSMNI